ncbi:major facilitator superfamily domain-containing protein [Xylogone sp. PMI_703]|nr:major facilitator superfamily domain-containing protein [Xylogone sp. PMI_703]
MSTTRHADGSSIELQSPLEDRHNSIHENGQDERSVPQELKPADRGRDAWIVLIAGFIFEALFWGFPMCFGVFQNYYSNIPEFRSDSDNIALIGTLAQGLYFLGAPFSAMLTKRFLKYQRQQIWLGWPMCILGLLTASFAKTVPGLIATQGVLYGLGFVILTYPIISMINEWWVIRKGMAFGLISAASGATGAVMPIIIESLLHRYGYSATLRATAVAMTLLTGPLIPLFRGRLPISNNTTLPSRTNRNFLQKPLFWIYSLSVLVQGLGFFIPPVFLSSYATSVGLSSVKGALLLAIMSISQVLGQFTLGYMSDKKLSVSFLAIFSSLIAAIASLIFWGFAKSIPLLMVFSIVYGFFAFGFGTLRTAMGQAVSDDPSTFFTTYSIFAFLQGLGNVLVSPISSALLSSRITMREHYAAGRYDRVVIFTGSSSGLAAFIIILWHIYKSLGKATR